MAAEPLRPRLRRDRRLAGDREPRRERDQRGHAAGWLAALRLAAAARQEDLSVPLEKVVFHKN